MNITVNGLTINVDVHDSRTDSEKPALVFLHYWGGSSRTWQPLIAALPHQYLTVAPDLRGWGHSDKPPTGYALNDFVNDALELLDALNITKYVLVGHSMGGKIAQLMAARQPAGLCGLVLVAPAPPTPLALPAEALTAMEHAYESRTSVELAIDHMLTAKRLDASLREQVIEDSLRGSRQAQLAWPSATSREDITLEVARIQAPAIVIAGDRDRVDTVATLKAEVLARIPQAIMHIVPNTGHLSPLESPIELAKLIDDFVKSLPMHP